MYPDCAYILMDFFRFENLSFVFLPPPLPPSQAVKVPLAMCRLFEYPHGCMSMCAGVGVCTWG